VYGFFEVAPLAPALLQRINFPNKTILYTLAPPAPACRLR